MRESHTSSWSVGGRRHRHDVSCQASNSRVRVEFPSAGNAEHFLDIFRRKGRRARSVRHGCHRSLALPPAEHTAICNELSRIEEAASYSSQSQFSSAKFWRGLNLVLGVPAAVLAAIAGTTVLADASNAKTGAVIALVSAALTAVMTTLNAAQRAEQSRGAANAYLALQGDARLLRTIDLRGLDHDGARQRLDELVQRRNAINETAPVPAFIAYLMGARNIDKGRQTYGVDK